LDDKLFGKRFIIVTGASSDAASIKSVELGLSGVWVGEEAMISLLLLHLTGRQRSLQKGTEIFMFQ
jgi:hypothetical protein